MAEPAPPNVGAKVLEWRQRRGMSLRVLAAACDLSPNTISLIERGVSSPSVSTLHRLATALRAPIASSSEEGIEKVELIAGRAGQRHGERNRRGGARHFLALPEFGAGRLGRIHPSGDGVELLELELAGGGADLPVEVAVVGVDHL